MSVQLTTRHRARQIIPSLLSTIVKLRSWMWCGPPRAQSQEPRAQSPEPRTPPGLPDPSSSRDSYDGETVSATVSKSHDRANIVLE